MNRQLPFLVIATALCCVAVSCTKDDAESVAGDRTEIRLSSGIRIQSRTAFPEADVQVPSGESVAVWIDQRGDQTKPLYQNYALLADGNGGLTGERKMYFPLNGNNIDIYALHTNAYYAGSAYPTATMTHAVSNDQSKLKQYAQSDLLYGRAIDIAKTRNAVPITFYHLLSKIQVAVCPVEGVKAEDIQSIAIGGTKRMANITLDKSTAPNAITPAPAGSASNIFVGTDASTDFSEGNVRYNDAVIVPQTVAEGTAFITVTLKTGESLVYRLTRDVRFESGKKYTCHMTISLTDIKLSTSVSDWKPGDLITGNNDIIHYVVHYSDNTQETIYSDTKGRIEFNGAGKTVSRIDLPDLGKGYYIGRRNLTGIDLNIDDAGNLHFRPSVDGYTPIGSYAELQMINDSASTRAGVYKQEADLDLMSVAWTPIAEFTGKYDGAGFDIDRLYISSTDASNVGLFGSIVGTYAEIRDVHIASGSITKESRNFCYVGAVCGWSDGGNIEKCTNLAMITAESLNAAYSSYAGGIAGYNKAGNIANCGNYGILSSSGYCYCGGITGYNSGKIVACCNKASVSSNKGAGGISRLNSGTGSIIACYNTGTVYVNGNNYAGGIVGENSGANIQSCYSTAAVNAYYAGGVVGRLDGGITTSCYWKTGTGLPVEGVYYIEGGTATDILSFTDTFTPDAEKYPEWGLGNGETNGWWKNYNGNNNLPQLWWE